MTILSSVYRTADRRLFRGGCIYGDAAAIELEAQQPHSRALSVCRSELPFPGGLACEAGEIPARPGILQFGGDDPARAIDSHSNRNLYAAVNGFTRAARYFGNLFVNDRL